MKKNLRLFIIISLFLALNCSQQSKLHLGIVNQMIEDIRDEYAPDRRTSVFDVSASIEHDTLNLDGAVLSRDALDVLLRKTDSLGIYTVSDNVIVLPDSSALKEETYAIIRLSTSQIRRHPEIESELISQALMGSEIRLLRKGPGRRSLWRFCQMEDHYLGWIMLSSFVSGDEAFIQDWRNKNKVIVMENYSRVFQSMSDQSCQVSDLVCGNKLINLGSQADWVHVELPDGRQGYVKAGHVMSEETFNSRPKPTPSQIVKTAKAFNGIPYLWGGTSVKGFDCSGFTQTVYRLNGIQLPRDANMQVHSGTPVSLEDGYEQLNVGDLLFWGPDSLKITHVGIYIGDYEFIHSDGFVHINSLRPDDDDYSDYRRRSLRAARRILID